MCGNAVPRGFVKYCSVECRSHADKAKQKAWRDAHAARGLCKTCGSKPAPRLKHCRACLDRYACFNRMGRAARRASGCPRCGAPRDSELRYCALCRDYMLRYRESQGERTGETWREYINRLNAERRARRRAEA